MAKRRSSLAICGYKFAVLFSIFIHLFFVTAVEGAALLGKVFDVSTRRPLMIMKTIHHPPYTKESKWLARPKVDPAIDLTQTTSKRERKNQATQSQKSNPTKRGGSLFDPAVQKFEALQPDIDQRIQRFKSALIGRVTQKHEVLPIEILMSHVSNLEKVPVQAQKDLLPAYLERMRFKVASGWFQMIQSLGSKSGVTTVEYRIAPNGTISDLKVLSAAAENEFQESCLAAVRKASPFDPLSFHFEEYVKEQYVTVTLTFHFRTKDSKKLV